MTIAEVVDSDNTVAQSVRVILYHKTPTSAKTSFLKFSNDGILGLGSLPALSEVVEPGDKTRQNEIMMHPSLLLQEVSDHLNYPIDSMEVDTEYFEKIDVSGDCLSVFLLRFTEIDPPAELAARLGGAFISITEARNISAVELELLRRAYTAIMEG